MGIRFSESLKKNGVETFTKSLMQNKKALIAVLAIPLSIAGLASGIVFAKHGSAPAANAAEVQSAVVATPATQAAIAPAVIDDKNTTQDAETNDDQTAIKADIDKETNDDQAVVGTQVHDTDQETNDGSFSQ
jgi:flagellar basal body-associated protein FliL